VADPGFAGREPQAVRGVRVTWVQAEDLIGHELRQAREEGKDVDVIERRWLDAGGSPAPARGASQEPSSPELVRLAGELLDEVAALPRPLAEAEPEGFDQILAAAERERPRGASGDLRRALTGAWLGRAVGCVLGKPVENVHRPGIRAILEAEARWPLDRWFTAVGLPPEVSERHPWNKASRPTSLEENIDGIAEDDDLNFTMLGVVLLERHGIAFDAADVAKLWLDFLPPGRIFTAERVAQRNLLLGLLPPETATFRNPFREWIGARLRVDALGWAAAGDPAEAARLAWEDARLSHTANGVYAAMWMAAAHASSLVDPSAAAAVDAGLAVIPARSRLAEAIRAARDLARSDAEWEAVVDGLYERYGSYHWVHAINNTALVAAALVRFDGDFDGAVCGVVQGGWDTDTNGAAVGSILGAQVGPGGIRPDWSEPLHGRFASSLPGFDGVTLDELVERTLAVVGDRAAA
jgi:ADP-ribosylglycohydrolase